jgi:potassium efflux system protein
LNELEQQHRRILFRRRDALEKLSQRSSRTLQEIARRLSILDQEYGFIRTQIFWVRDQEPIAFGTFWQGAREVNVLLKAALRLARESATASLWGRPSAECMAMSLAVLLLPVPVMKLRRALGGMIES